MKNTSLLALLLCFNLFSTAQSWYPVGDAVVDSAAELTAMTVDASGKLFVIYQDQADGNRAKVKTYISSLGWQQVGGAVSPSGAAFLCISVSPVDGNVFVAYQDSAASNKASVLKYNGTAWVPPGSFPQVSPAPAEHLSLTVDKHGYPYLGYTDYSTGAKAIVKKFDGSGWVYMGANTPSPGTQTNTRIAVDTSDTLYVAYTDIPNASKITVRKLVDTTWTDVGTAGFSADTAEHIAIAVSRSGIPFVAFSDAGLGRKAAVKKYNGTSWIDVGTTSMTEGRATNITMIVDTTEKPYVAYRDYNSGSLPSGSSVRTFTSGLWQYVGGQVFSSGPVHHPHIASGPLGSLYITFVREEGIKNRAYVNKLAYAISPGFRNIESGISVNVHPNPSSGIIRVYVTSTTIEPIYLTITDLTGHEIKRLTGFTNKEIELKSDIPPGTYILSATAHEKTQATTFIKY
jgi:hypothetical protein